MVSWQLPTTIEAVVLLVALARIGAVQNPLIPILREREVSFITQQVGTELLIVPEEWRGFPHGAMARDLAASGGFEVMEIDLHELGTPGSPQGLRLPTADPNSSALIPSHRHRSTVPVGSTTRQAPPPTPRAPAIRTPASCPRPTPCSNSWDSVRAMSIRSPGRSRISVARPSWHRAFAAGSTSSSSRPSTPRKPPVGWLCYEPTALGTAVPFFRAYLDAARESDDAALFPSLRFGSFRRCPRSHRDPPRNAGDVRRAARRQLGAHRVPQRHVRGTH